MKKILSILLFVTSVLLQAQTTYYVVASGGSDANTGADSTANAWATLAYAVANVSSGDTVFLCSGTHAISSRVTVPVGVNIKGNGVSSIISSSVTTTYYVTLYLHSTTEGTNGNQSISYIKMDGNETAWGAIQINARSNVSIHHCTFIDFFSTGTIFNSSTAYAPPDVYATGNKYYNNISTNCSDYPTVDDGQGHLMFGGQVGMKIYNNTMTQTTRGLRRNGYLIKFYSYGYNTAFEIYNNTLTRSEDAPSGIYYDFAIECWHTKGGAKIYNNTMTHGIDFGGAITYVCLEKNGYDYGAWVYGNTIGSETSVSGKTGIYLERNTNGAIIEKNTFKNLYNGIFLYCNSGETIENHRISYNIFNNIGYYGIRFINGATGGTVDSIDIDNNVFYSPAATSNLIGIGLLSIGTTTYLDVRNNIIQGFDYAPMFANGASGQTIDNLNIKNNIMYGNGNSNAPLFSSLTPTNYTNSNNLTSNPAFTDAANSDFTIPTGSPAKDTGLNIGLPTDYLGNVVPYNVTTDIGAYEFGAGAAVPVTAITVFGTGNATTIEVNDGTLQMLYTADPANATDTTVVWSVTNGTGSATIGLNGLLTAIADGTVTVRATALDGSGEYDDQVITISNQDAITLPTVTTRFTSTKSTNATFQGNVTDDGGGTISARGFVYGTSINPSLSNSALTVSGTTGIYSGTLTRLLSNTTYHVRSYCTNESGTSYGADVSFTTTVFTILKATNIIMLPNGKIGAIIDP